MKETPEKTLRDILSPTTLNTLAGEGESKKVIPADIRQQELAKIGVLATSAEKFPAVGDQATLRFSNGVTQDVKVNGYDKLSGVPLVQVGVGKEQAIASNIDMIAFENLTNQKK